MAESLDFDERSPLRGLASPVGPTPPGVVVREMSGLALAVVTARKSRTAELAARLDDRFGVVLVDGPRCAGAKGIAFLGVAPSRWLMVADSADSEFVERLSATLTDVAGVVDQSGGLVVIRLSGPRVLSAFEKGLAIDLDPSSFPVGAVAVTSVAQIGVTLWAAPGVEPLASPVYMLAVGRSFAASFWGWLSEAAAEFGLGLDTPG